MKGIFYKKYFVGLTEEQAKMLEEIRRYYMYTSMTETIRFCICEVYKKMQKEKNR